LYGKFGFFDSTISHIGFLLLALAINTEQSIDSFLFYLIQYTITNLNIFLIILALTYIIYANAPSTRSKEFYNNFVFNINETHNSKEMAEVETDLNKTESIKDIRYISELKGLFFSNPLLSLSLGICLFSMAGIPPLIGFFSKQFVLYSALQNGYYFISLIAIIVSVISASYYLKIIKVLHTSTGAAEQEAEYNVVETYKRSQSAANPTIALTNTHSFLISSLTLIILLFFIKPSIILNSTQLLSLSLFYI
jgi:NADH-ubiquinone oxidoreductase chain 2